MFAIAGIDAERVTSVIVNGLAVAGAFLAGYILFGVLAWFPILGSGRFIVHGDLINPDLFNLERCRSNRLDKRHAAQSCRAFLQRCLEPLRPLRVAAKSSG